MTDSQKQEFTLRISQANKTEIIVILYEMVLVYIEEAKEADKAGDKIAFKDATRKIRGCINELTTSLHLEYDLAKNLLQLYQYMNRELAKADLKKDITFVENVEEVIKELHQSYKELAAKDTSGPVMDNVQTVYAGLTYGRSALTEDLTYQSTNRGFVI